MGLRFNRRLRIAPGITLNLGKRGVSTSVGATGAKVTVGRTGVRGTVGLPGTGLSYTEHLKPSLDSADTGPIPIDRPREHLPARTVIAIVLLALALLVGRFLLTGK
jgi:hypothetical protein